MEEKERKKKLLKKRLAELFKDAGFKKLGSGWYLEHENHIVVLELQASSYSSLYYLNIKLYVRGLWGNSYPLDKELVRDMGNVSFTVVPPYDLGLDLENDLSDEERLYLLEKMARECVLPLAHKLLTAEGVFELYEEKLAGRNNLPFFDNVINELRRIRNKP